MKTYKITNDAIVVDIKDEPFDQIVSLFSLTMKFLIKKGFTVTSDKKVDKDYPILSKYHREGYKGELKFKAEIGDNNINIRFYQSTDSESFAGGCFDAATISTAPYLFKKQFERVVKNLSVWFEKRGAKNTSKPQYIFAEDKIKADYCNSKHHPQETMDFSLDDLNGTTVEPCNAKDKNGNVIHNGDIKYFRSYGGYLCRGKCYHNINNMWWIITDSKTVRNVACFELFDLTDDVPRCRVAPKKIPPKIIERRRVLNETSTKDLIAELKRRGIKVVQ